MLAYEVSENMVLISIDEWLDFVPINKIIGFGGDLIILPQLIVGKLDVAKQVLCKAFARRIEEGRIDMNDAKSIFKAWF
jgi:hypothetical protein